MSGHAVSCAVIGIRDGMEGTRRITLHALRILACEIMQRPIQLSHADVPHDPRLQVALFTAMALLEFANRADEKCRQRGVAATEANARHHHIALRAWPLGYCRGSSQ